MKAFLRSFLCLVFISGATNLCSQSTGYVAIPDPAQSGYIAKIHRTSTNHYISCGTSGSGSAQHEVTYWDSNFNPVWCQYFASAAVLYWIDVVETNDGNFVALGANQNNSGCNIAIKFNTSGTVLWQKEYYVSGNFLTSFSLAKAAGNDPGFVFGGGACAASSFIIRCDASGNILWQKEYFITISGGVQTTWCIIPENNSYVLGGDWLNGSQDDIFFTKIDSAGTWQFTTLTNEPTLSEIPVKMIKLSTGNYAMICNYNSGPNYAELIYYFNPSGNIFQGTKFVGPANEQIDFRDVEETNNGQVMVVGDINDSPMKYLYMKLSGGGVTVWQKKATGVNPGYMNGTCYGVAKTASGNYAIAGAAYEDGRTITVIDTTGSGFCNAVAGNTTVAPPDAYTMSNFTPTIISPNVLAQTVNNTSTPLTLTHSTLCGTTGIQEAEAHDPLQVYPNPAHGVIKISFGGMDFPDTEVEFYNNLGQRAMTGYIENGSVNISALPTGTYMMRIHWHDDDLVKIVVVE
jgi:hypothetical protein